MIGKRFLYLLILLYGCDSTKTIVQEQQVNIFGVYRNEICGELSINEYNLMRNNIILIHKIEIIKGYIYLRTEKT